MKALLIVPYYIRWHYSTAIRSIARIVENIIWFIWHFFSIELQAKTLFAPWQRLREVRKRGFDLEDMLGTWLINLVMRFVGFLVKIVFIIIGLVAIVVTFILSAGFVVIWLALPFIIIFLFVFGFVLIFKPQ
jgi:hypothetical protein